MEKNILHPFLERPSIVMNALKKEQDDINEKISKILIPLKSMANLHDIKIASDASSSKAIHRRKIIPILGSDVIISLLYHTLSFTVNMESYFLLEISIGGHLHDTNK